MLEEAKAGDVMKLTSLNPGIKHTVGWMASKCFQTTDSGDGKTNVEAGMEGALTVPHVHAVCDIAVMVHEAERLHRLLVEMGLDPDETAKVEGFEDQDGPAWWVECHYTVGSVGPEGNKIGIVSLWGVDDAKLLAAHGYPYKEPTSWRT